MLSKAPPGTLKTLDQQLFEKGSSFAIQTFVAAFVASILGNNSDWSDALNLWMRTYCDHLRDDADVTARCGENQLRLLRKDVKGVKLHITSKPIIVHVLTRILTQAFDYGTSNLQLDLDRALTIIPDAHTVLSEIYSHLRGNWHCMLTPRRVGPQQRCLGPEQNIVVIAMVTTAVRIVRNGLFAVFDEYTDGTKKLVVPANDREIFERTQCIVDEGLFEFVDEFDNRSEGEELRHVPLVAFAILHSLYSVGTVPFTFHNMLTDNGKGCNGAQRTHFMESESERKSESER